MELTLKNVSKTYTTGAGKSLEVLRGVSCTFPDNCSISIQGQSGVGKSTLLHLLSGLDGVDSGEIWYGETEVSKLSEEELAFFRREHVGVVFQSHNLLPEFSALENVALPLIISGVPEDESLERARAVLQRVGLGERIEHRPSMLSGGEQQRVAVGRAVVAEPTLLLADEPTGNLDPETAEEIGNLLLELQREKKNTLIVVTHSSELAQTLQKSFHMRSEGRLEELGCLEAS